MLAVAPEERIEPAEPDLVPNFVIAFESPEWYSGHRDGRSALPPRFRRLQNATYIDGWITGWMEHRHEQTVLR